VGPESLGHEIVSRAEAAASAAVSEYYDPLRVVRHDEGGAK
jgi:hypothetical protein